MTTTASDDTLTVVKSPEPTPAPPVPRHRRPVLGVALVMVGIALIGVVFVEFVAGAALQQRDQRAAATEFDETLQTAMTSIGLPDVSPLPIVAPAVGEPLVVLEIPAIGLSQVVLEGDDHGVLQSGPAHVSGTPLPGQPGNASIVGRRTTFGGPFFSLDTLAPGDSIVTTSVQGQAEYLVTEVGVSDSDDPFARTDTNVLTLLTGDPAGLASRSLVVSAELQDDPFVPTPQNARTFASPLAPDVSQWSQILVWGALLAGVLLAVLMAWRLSVPRPVVWVLGVPTVMASTLLFAQSLDYLLPAVL